jgi:hypothetical protein
MARKPSSDYERQVFINCPFDDAYWPLMKAQMFGIQACGCRPRCARESDDAAEVRIEKILRIIQECRLGIHDLSRKGSDPAHGLARFNMPFELGLFLGAARYTRQRKSLLILETKPYDYQKFISDISGQDIRAHDDREDKIIRHVRDWLNTQRLGRLLPGASALLALYRRFQTDTPLLLREVSMIEADATFLDWVSLIWVWLERNGIATLPPTQ